MWKVEKQSRYFNFFWNLNPYSECSYEIINRWSHSYLFLILKIVYEYIVSKPQKTKLIIKFIAQNIGRNTIILIELMEKKFAGSMKCRWSLFC